MYKLISIAIGAVLLTASAAAAQIMQCDDRDKVVSKLAKKYQETPIAMGVTGKGGLVEVLADHKSGTWTIIVTTPTGLSCLVASGEGWRSLAPIITDPEA